MKIARITNDGKLLIKGEVIENEGETYDFDGTNRVDIKPFVSPENNMFNNENFIPVSKTPRLTNNGDLYINDIVELGDNYYLDLPMNNSQVIVPYNPVLHLSSAFTICLWFKLNDVSGLKQLLGQGAWGTSWTFWISVGRPLLTLNGTHYFSPNNVAVANEWCHMAISYNAGEIKYYWNGQYLSTTNGITNFTGTTHNLFFNYSQYPYNGGLKDARIFNRVLADAEVEDIYNNTNHAVGDEILWLPFNEGEGNIAYDKSGNGNHGTIINGEWESEPVNIKLKDGVLYVSELIENAIL